MPDRMQSGMETLQKMAIIIVVTAIAFSLVSLFSNAAGKSLQHALIDACWTGQLQVSDLRSQV